MTREQIVNKIAVEKHGRQFSEIVSIKSRAEILQQALDEVISQVNKTNLCQSVSDEKKEQKL